MAPPSEHFQVPHTPPPPPPPEAYNYLLQGSASHPSPPGTAPLAGPSSLYVPNPPISFPSPVVPRTNAPLHSPPLVAAPQDPEEATSVAEEKRRRNTAASARFRVKKKLITLSLERTVTDLTGRTEALEREASDLRRENTWLKEIVLLKGRNIAALNLGSQAPASQNRHDEGDEDDRAHTDSESESTAKPEGKGENKHG